MLRRIVSWLLIAAILIVVGLWWQAARNTPQAVATAFTKELATGKTDTAYQRLTSGLTQGRESYWQEYLQEFKTSKSEPVLSKEDQVIDSFNTYTAAEDPHRFTYMYQLEKGDYQIVFLLIKEGKAWKVDELYGAAVKSIRQ